MKTIRYREPKDGRMKSCFYGLAKGVYLNTIISEGICVEREDLDSIPAITRSHMEAKRCGRTVSCDVSATDTSVHPGRTLVERIYAIVA
jgi:hypothetical protein